MIFLLLILYAAPLVCSAHASRFAKTVVNANNDHLFALLRHLQPGVATMRVKACVDSLKAQLEAMPHKTEIAALNIYPDSEETLSVHYNPEERVLALSDTFCILKPGLARTITLYELYNLTAHGKGTTPNTTDNQELAIRALTDCRACNTELLIAFTAHHLAEHAAKFSHISEAITPADLKKLSRTLLNENVAIKAARAVRPSIPKTHVCWMHTADAMVYASLNKPNREN